jgi:nucleotide-binding universal stress UspA family protein
MTIMRTILVPVDFSVGSEAALEHARDLAEMYDSDLLYCM